VVESADQDSLRGHVLSNGIDANGRMIGFVFPGEPPGPDGGTVFLDGPLVDTSINAALLAAGLVYPAFYATLPATLRTHLAAASRAARAAGTGLWPRSTADPNGAATVADLPGLEQLVCWPKLFRRLVPYLATGMSTLDGFDAWLRADPVNRDDSLFLLDRLENGRMHDVVRAEANYVQLTTWPEDFIIDPDPAPPGTPVEPVPMNAGDVLILAVLPDPAGTDLAHEVLTLLNTAAVPVDLTGWSVHDRGGSSKLGGTLAAGAVTQVTLSEGVQLGNEGDTLTLIDPVGRPIDRVSYTAGEVKPGRTIAFR
jgi:hypothetical protein